MVRFVGDITDLQRSVENVGHLMENVGRNAFGGGLMGGLTAGAIGAGMNLITSGLEGAIHLAESLGEKVLEAGKTIIETGLEQNANLESASVKWMAFTNNAEKAKKIVGDIQILTAETIFPTAQADRLYATFYKMGGSAQETFDAVKGLSGVMEMNGSYSSTDVRDVVKELGELWNMNKINMTQVNSLKLHGVDIYREAAMAQMHETDLTKKQTEAVTKQAEEIQAQYKAHKISAQDVLKLTEQSLAAQSLLADKYADTWNGQMTRIKTIFSVWSGEVTNSLFNVLKPKLSEFSSAFTDLALNWDKYMAGASDWAKDSKNPFVKLANTLHPLVKAAADTGQAFVEILGSKNMAEVDANFKKFNKTLDGLFKAFGDVWTKISTFIGRLWTDHLEKPFKELWDKVTSFVASQLGGDKAIAIYQEVGTQIGGAIIEGIGKAIGAGLKSIMGSLGNDILGNLSFGHLGTPSFASTSSKVDPSTLRSVVANNNAHSGGSVGSGNYTKSANITINTMHPQSAHQISQSVIRSLDKAGLFFK